MIGFALLIAPGIVWELQKSKHEPTEKQTALVEASRIILASFLATTLSALLLLGPLWLPLYYDYIKDPNDFILTPDFSVSFGTTLLFNSLIACAISFLFAFFKWPQKSQIQGIRVWHRIFVKDKPKACEKPYLIVELVDGTIWRGLLMSFDSAPEDTQRDLALGQPLKRKRPEEKTFKEIADSQRYVVLAESQVRSMQVAFPV